MSAHTAPTNVLIAGVGVAAPETAPALQAPTDENVRVELLAPEPALWHRSPRRRRAVRGAAGQATSRRL